MRWLKLSLFALVFVFSLNSFAESKWHCGQLSGTESDDYPVQIVQQGLDKTVSAYLDVDSPVVGYKIIRLLESGGTVCILGEVQKTENGYVIRVEDARPRLSRSGIGVTIE